MAINYDRRLATLRVFRWLIYGNLALGSISLTAGFSGLLSQNVYLSLSLASLVIAIVLYFAQERMMR
jgi:hypothetical protein